MFLIEWVQKKTIVASATAKTIEKALELANCPNEHNATRVVIYQKVGEVTKKYTRKYHTNGHQD